METEFDYDFVHDSSWTRPRAHAVVETIVRTTTPIPDTHDCDEKVNDIISIINQFQHKLNQLQIEVDILKHKKCWCSLHYGEPYMSGSRRKTAPASYLMEKITTLKVNSLERKKGFRHKRVPSSSVVLDSNSKRSSIPKPIQRNRISSENKSARDSLLSIEGQRHSAKMKSLKLTLSKEIGSTETYALFRKFTKRQNPEPFIKDLMRVDHTSERFNQAFAELEKLGQQDFNTQLIHDYFVSERLMTYADIVKPYLSYKVGSNDT